MAKHHEILEINFSNSTPWKTDRKDIAITVDLGIAEGRKVSMKVELENADKARHEILSETAFTEETARKFTVNRNKLIVGKNTVWVTFKDELDDGGITEFEHDITVEDRDTFAIKRDFAFPDEYLKTGILKLGKDGLTMIAKGLEEGIAVAKNPIQMDGRSKIESIIVHGDNDTVSNEKVVQKAAYRQDRGDSIIQKIPLTNIKSFESVTKIQMVDRKGED